MDLDGLPHRALHVVLTGVAAEEDVDGKRAARDLQRKGRGQGSVRELIYTRSP